MLLFSLSSFFLNGDHFIIVLLDSVENMVTRFRRKLKNKMIEEKHHCAVWPNSWRFTGCFHSGVETGDGGSCAFDVALFIYKVCLRRKKLRESCFPEPLGNPTTELGLFAYASKTLSSQRSAQKASFLCLLWHNFQWFLGDCLAFGFLVAFTLLLARRLQPHEALLSPEHRSHSRGSFSVPLLKQESWTFTSVYPKIIGFFFSLHILASTSFHPAASTTAQMPISAFAS